MSYQDLQWSAEHWPATRTWHVVGRSPGRAGVRIDLQVRMVPRYTDAGRVAAVTATLLNELDAAVGDLIDGLHDHAPPASRPAGTAGAAGGMDGAVRPISSAQSHRINPPVH